MTLFNDAVARLLVAGTPLAAAVATRAMARRIAAFPRDQDALRERYGITADTPIRGYDEETRSAVLSCARADKTARLATTSGSTGAPKELAYTAERLRLYKRDSVSGAVRAYARYGVRRPGMFILASMKPDDSFASLVLHGRGARPPYLAGLVEPSRHLADEALVELTSDVGATAVRLWLMMVADPGMIYATNPSTIAAFFTEVVERWRESTALVRRFLNGDLKTHAGLARIVRRVGAAGHGARLAAAADADAAPPTWELLPGLTAYCTWDGGYVTAFLPEVHRHLPPDRYAHVPMYSMSTEVIETLTWFDEQGDIRFLPLAPGVLYELLPEDAEDVPDALLPATACVPGRVYSMVVSDPWGLRRYQTDDLFLCAAISSGLPDLRFLRRRGLAWSFTGEKLTGEQLTDAYRELRAAFPALSRGVDLACFPSQPPGEPVPRYRLVLARTTADALDVDLDALIEAFDASLMRANHELAAKRSSGRLARPQASITTYDELAQVLDRRTHTDDDIAKRSWESQFKLTPLVKTPWEEVAGRLAAHRRATIHV